MVAPADCAPLECWLVLKPRFDALVFRVQCYDVIASDIGVPRSTICRWVRGLSTPRTLHLRAIVRTLERAACGLLRLQP